MTKILVDKQSGEIRGRYEEPLDFSIAGRYVIDIPEGFGINPETNSVASLLTEKIDTFIRLHPTLPNFFYDEFLSVPPPNIDVANSFRSHIGPDKRTAILPGGYVHTNALVTIAGFNTTYIHLHGFILHSEPGDPSAAHPSPSRLLYNNTGSGFIDFDYNDFLVEYWDSPGGVLEHTATPELEDTGWTEPGSKSFVIKFTNIHATRTYYLSNWTFLYSNP